MGGDAATDEVAPLRTSFTRACLAALVAVCLHPASSAAASVEQSAPIEVQTSLRATAPFGQPLTARVVVVLQRDAVEADRLRVTAPLEPLTQLAASRVSRSSRGDTDVVTYDVSAACLDQRCVAPDGARKLRLPVVRAEVPLRTGSLVSATGHWPTLTIRGRVRASDITRSPLPFKSDLEAPKVTYRFAPSRLTGVLVAIALGLALTAVALATIHVARMVRRHRFVEMGELERALALARSSESRSAEDRRRALGLLARVLGARGQRLAPATSTLAWSAPLPSPGSVSTLVEQVEHEVEAP